MINTVYLLNFLESKMILPTIRSWSIMNDLPLPLASNLFHILKKVYNLQNFQQLANPKKITLKWLLKQFSTVGLSYGILFQVKLGNLSFIQYLEKR